MSDYDWEGWTEWQQLAAIDLASVPTGPGTYVVSAAKPVTRAVGADPLGILDIGESGYLRQRLKDLIRCAKNHGEEGHMAGWRYAFFRFARHFPFESLQIRWTSAPSKQLARELEGRMMLAYLTKHCELPPLNYSFNWDMFEREGWSIFDVAIKWHESQPPKGA